MGALDRLQMKLSKVKAYERKSKSGKLITVHEYTNSVSKKAAEALGGGQSSARGTAKSGTFTRPAPPATPAAPTPRPATPLRTAMKKADKYGSGITSEQAAASGQSKAPGYKPLTDEEYQAHTAMVEKTLKEAEKAGLRTDDTYSHHGIWDPEREKMHAEIVNDLFDKQAKTAKQEAKCLIAGGLGGAGKGTILRDHLGLDPKQWITINPDDVKEEMAKRGMIPEVKGLTPMEGSALVHEESGHIANLLLKRAEQDHYNVIQDITMSSTQTIDRRLHELSSYDYKDVRALFVNIPVESSVTRALSRHRRGLEASRQGAPGALGGRYVPPSIIRMSAHREKGSINRAAFESMKHHFSGWTLFDNSGDTPKKVSEGGGGIVGALKGGDSGSKPGTRSD